MCLTSDGRGPRPWASEHGLRRREGGGISIPIQYLPNNRLNPLQRRTLWVLRSNTHMGADVGRGAARWGGAGQQQGAFVFVRVVMLVTPATVAKLPGQVRSRAATRGSVLAFPSPAPTFHAPPGTAAPLAAWGYRNKSNRKGLPAGRGAGSGRAD